MLNGVSVDMTGSRGMLPWSCLSAQVFTEVFTVWLCWGWDGLAVEAGDDDPTSAHEDSRHSRMELIKCLGTSQELGCSFQLLLQLTGKL